MMVNLRGPRPIVQVIYRVVPLKDGAFVVEIDIPGTWPTKTAQTFSTEPKQRLGSRGRLRGAPEDRARGTGQMRDQRLLIEAPISGDEPMTTPLLAPASAARPFAPARRSLQPQAGRVTSVPKYDWA